MRAAAAALIICAVSAPLAAQFSPELRGRITDARTGAALADVDVHLESGERARTAVDGSFVLRAALPGANRLSVRRIGYAPRAVAVTLVNGSVTPLALALTVRTVQLAEIAATTDARRTDAIVLTRAEIAARGARDVADLLQGIAGVVVTRRGGPGAPATVSVRGASAGQLLVLVDGIPLNAPLTGDADLSSIAASDLERVELLRGAASARYGPQALAGALLIETRRPTATSLELEAAGGSYGDRAARTRLAAATATGLTAALQADLRRGANDFAYDVPAVRGGGTALRTNADVRRLQASAQVGIERGDRRLRLRADLSDIARGMPGSIVQPAIAARQSDRRWSLQLAGAEPLGAWQLDADASVQNQRTRWRDSVPPLSAAYDDRASLRSWQARSSVARTRRALRLGVGADARILEIASTTLAATAPPALRYAGLYASADQQLALGNGWRGDLGLDARADIGTLVPGTVISPKLRARLARGRAGVTLAWGQGFAPPTPADLFFQDGVQVQPNPNLRPERVRSYLSVSLDLRGIAVGALVADIEAAAYTADIDGMILWSPNFRFVWSPFNADVARRGGEAALRLAHRRSATSLQLQGALTDVRYRGAVATGQVVYRPRWTAAARLETSIARVESALAWRLTGERRTAAGSSENLLPAFGLVDLQLQRTLTAGRETIRLRLGLENLLDSRIAMLPDFPMPGRTWTVGAAVTLPITRSTTREMP